MVSENIKENERKKTVGGKLVKIVRYEL